MDVKFPRHGHRDGENRCALNAAREGAIDICIPITVGITGHRDLRPEDRPALCQLVADELTELKTQHPHSPFVALSSLAEGADQLCAEVALDLGFSLICPLPVDADAYRADFSDEALVKFDALIRRADSYFPAPLSEPATEETNRDFFYRQAGIYVARHSHVLLALWDGCPRSLDGCGTAETVNFMLSGGYDDSQGACFKPAADGAVIHIRAPRASSVPTSPFSVNLIENEPGALHKTLRMTDTFNRDSGRIAVHSAAALAEPGFLALIDRRAQKMHQLYCRADALATALRDRYMRAMRWLSVFGVALVLGFLLYDELESNLFLPVSSVVIAAAVFLLARVRRQDIHANYLQYRVLAETLRAQFFLLASGVNRSIGDAFTWTQKNESVWVHKAVSGLMVGAAVSSAVEGDAIKRVWIDDQLAYHERAALREVKKLRISAGATQAMLFASAVLFAALLVLEFWFERAMPAVIPTDWLRPLLLMHEGQDVVVRGVLKIAFGVFSAVTLFFANYYGNLSLDRKVSDHQKMISLYRSARQKYQQQPHLRQQLYWELAREEIIETGNWFSYCLDNSPTLKF